MKKIILFLIVCIALTSCVKSDSEGSSSDSSSDDMSALSLNADLSRLPISGRDLTPEFSPEIANYSVAVPYEISSIYIYPAVESEGALLSVNGNTPVAEITEGLVGSHQSLQVGTTVIIITVTAADGITVKTYTITVTREIARVIVSGTIALPADQTGETIYVVIDDDTEPANGNLYSINATLTAGTTYSYSISEVINGSYHLYAYIDIDGNNYPGWNDGDYGGYYGTSGSTPPASKLLIISGNDETRNFSIVEINTPEITGTVTIPAEQQGKILHLVLDTDDDLLNGYTMKKDIILGAGTTHMFVFSGMSTAEYYIGAMVDVNGDGGLIPDNGDYKGYHNGTGTNPPEAASVNFSGLTESGNDFTLGTINGQNQITGAVTFPDSVEGKDIYISVMADYNNPANQEAYNLYIGGSSNTFDYVVSNIGDGTYYLIITVDNDGDQNPGESGEYRGFYGGDYGGMAPPGYALGNPQPNVTIISGGSLSGMDVTTGTVP